MSKAVFKKLGKTFKRANSKGHTHAFGIKILNYDYKKGQDVETVIASWGTSEGHAKSNLAERLRVSVFNLEPGEHKLNRWPGESTIFKVLDVEAVEVEL